MPAGNTHHQPPPPEMAAAAESNGQTKPVIIAPVCSACIAAAANPNPDPNGVLIAPHATAEAQTCTCRRQCTPTLLTTMITQRSRSCRQEYGDNADDALESFSQMSIRIPLVEEPEVESPISHETPLNSPVSEDTVVRAKAVPSRRQTEPLISFPTAPTTPPKPKRNLTQGPSSSNSNSFISDPFIDITRIRIKSRGSHCLYPGATFQGLQKSGANNYDVSVQIVDVDLNSSFLCGYLCIRGLTADFPEMTTYFDAEIIGNRHGFLTGKWGATDSEDMSHWANFPAFRQVKNELQEPKLTLPARDRGVIFMRWKERFLVPDHRVQDVSGASFAGFYYICIDMDGRAGADISRAPTTMSRSVSSQDGHLAAPKSPTSPRIARELLPTAMSRRTSSASKNGPATMSGFYFHPNSEPFQQLSLSHIPEVSHAAFEFR